MSATRFVQFLSGKRLDWSLACVAIVISMLPVSALKPWTNDVARLVLVPFVPVTHLGMFLRERIRPPQAIFDPRSPETIALDNEVARLRLLYEQTRLSSAQLEQTIQALRAVSTTRRLSKPQSSRLIRFASEESFKSTQVRVTASYLVPLFLSKGTCSPGSSVTRSAHSARR